jgi:HK97 family phage prohead protease
MEFKQLSHGIKELDSKEGIVTAYANVYNNIDADNDISAKGSFDKTAKEQRKRIRVLKDHNSTISLGVPIDLDTKDDFGLLTTTKFNLNKEVSRDMFSDIQLYKESGLNAELSIGYQIGKRNEKDERIIEEYKLLEYSFLTSWAANELATVQDIKSVKKVGGFMELLIKAYDLNYSDSRLKQIETILESLNKEPSDIEDTLKIADKSLRYKETAHALKDR